LHAPGQPEHAYCAPGDAQYVPNTGSVKPPDAAQVQLNASEYAVGCVVQTVAASFHARHALLSPMLNGYVPPSAVGAVVS